MRARLVGYAGDRPPVPGTEPVDPIDPNPDPPPDPDDPDLPSPLVLVLENGVPFLKASYQALGYNRFDVMCIGGAGGRGGNLPVLESAITQPSWVRYARTVPFQPANIVNTGPQLTGIRQDARFGGAGGGGGLHRIKGRLALLPSSVPVVVGAAGADGAHPAPGGDGGISSFGDPICRASGGKGGLPYGGSYTDAGRGGVGNSAFAGGGGVPGQPGTWDGVIGQGGGGAGNPANGGSGSVSPADPTTTGPGAPVGIVNLTQDEVLITGTIVESGTQNQAGTGVWVDYYALNHVIRERSAIPGAGGGAKPFQLNGENVQYGSRAEGLPGTGLVIVRLSYVIT